MIASSQNIGNKILQNVTKDYKILNGLLQKITKDFLEIFTTELAQFKFEARQTFYFLLSSAL